MTEAEWMDQLIGTTPGHEGIAVWLGWEAVHFRPARTAHGWRTPVQGTLGAGWPDLLLVRPPRIMAVELKADGKKATPEQQRVLALLAAAGVETHVWTPSQWEDVVASLR